MRIALLQAEAVPLDIEGNLAQIRDAAARAVAQGCELLLTPELFVSGYAPRELAEWLTAERVSGIPDALSEIAAADGISVAASFPLARTDGTFAIAAGLWDATGREMMRYEKVHLWGADEAKAFTPGRELSPIAMWNGRSVGFQICYDIEFPEPVRMLAERGADLVLVPTAIDGAAEYIPNVIVRARAAENSLVVAYADHPRAAAADSQGLAASDDFAGLSTVAGRGGEVYAQAGTGSELLIAEIPGVAPASADSDYLSDRRPDLYADWRR